jgi:hypothetical protein
MVTNHLRNDDCSGGDAAAAAAAVAAARDEKEDVPGIRPSDRAEREGEDQSVLGDEEVPIPAGSIEGVLAGSTHRTDCEKRFPPPTRRSTLLEAAAAAVVAACILAGDTLTTGGGGSMTGTDSTALHGWEASRSA